MVIYLRSAFLPCVCVFDAPRVAHDRPHMIEERRQEADLQADMQISHQHHSQLTRLLFSLSPPLFLFNLPFVDVGDHDDTIAHLISMLMVNTWIL